MDVAQELREYAEDCEETDSYGAWRQIDQSKLLGWANQLDQDRKPVDLTKLTDAELKDLDEKLRRQRTKIMAETFRRRDLVVGPPPSTDENVDSVLNAMRVAGGK
jgi:hypothetical protein